MTTRGHDILYSDDLLEIGRTWIRFRRYYFPFGSKTVNLSRVERVEVAPPTLLSGKWRMYGTGDLRTWFPADWRRPWRDRIFIVELSGTRRRIGFTAEDGEAVQHVLDELGLLHH